MLTANYMNKEMCKTNHGAWNDGAVHGHYANAHWKSKGKKNPQVLI